MDPAKVWHFCAEWALLRVTNCTGTGGAARRHQEIYVRSNSLWAWSLFKSAMPIHLFIFMAWGATLTWKRNSVRRNKIFCNKLYVGEWPIHYIISFNVLTTGQTGLCRHAECEYSAHVNRTEQYVHKHILLPLFKLNIEIGKTQKPSDHLLAAVKPLSISFLPEIKFATKKRPDTIKYGGKFLNSPSVKDVTG